MKKLFTLLMLTVMLTQALHVPANAQAPNPDLGGDASVQYTNVAQVSTSFYIASGGIAVGTSTATISKNYKSRLTMTLMKSKDKSTFTNVKSWSKDFTGVGTKSLTQGKSVSKGYYYRFKLVVRVISGDTVIEKITRYSSGVAYDV